MMPEEIKAIVRHLLAEQERTNLSWEGIAAHDWDKGNFDKLFEWLKQEAEKPSTGQLAADAARKVLKDPKASRAAKTMAASALTRMKKD